MTRRGGERRWSWYSQAVDLAFATLGFVAGVVMIVRNDYQILAIMFIVACATGVSSSQVLRALLRRWEDKP